MSPLRLAVLTLGPVAILFASYGLSQPLGDPEQAAFLARVQAAETRSARIEAASADQLNSACRRTEQALRDKFPDGFVTLVRPPFVIAGDIEPDRLAALHDNALHPTARALWRTYCDRTPDGPVTVVVLATDERYRQIARDLDGYDVTSYAAYYNREARRIVLTVGSGSGTLAHELTHALVQFDFPDLPEWLDEGLAALHEETAFSDDGLFLEPQSNWRCRLLAEAAAKNRLPALADLVRTQSFRGEGEGLNYAYVRGLCFYLHERGLLSHYYRKFRDRAVFDPSGLHTLCDAMDAKDASEIDRQFSEWLAHRRP